LSTTFDFYARGDRQGDVSIRNAANDQELVRLPVQAGRLICSCSAQTANIWPRITGWVCPTN